MINKFVEEEAISQPIMDECVKKLVERIKLSAERDIDSCYNELGAAFRPHCQYVNQINRVVEVICKAIGIDLFPDAH